MNLAGLENNFLPALSIWISFFSLRAATSSSMRLSRFYINILEIPTQLLNTEKKLQEEVSVKN